MTWTRRSADGGPAELGATAVTYALMIAIVALLLSVGFILLQGGVAANLRSGGDCLASIDRERLAGGAPACPPAGGGPSGDPGGPPGTTTTSSSTTTSTTRPA